MVEQSEPTDPVIFCCVSGFCGGPRINLVFALFRGLIWLKDFLRAVGCLKQTFFLFSSDRISIPSPEHHRIQLEHVFEVLLPSTGDHFVTTIAQLEKTGLITSNTPVKTGLLVSCQIVSFHSAHAMGSLMNREPLTQLRRLNTTKSF